MNEYKDEKISLNESKNCPACGQPLPAGALAGLCPACLLAQGMETREAGQPAGERFEPLPVEEVAKLFPQLELISLLGAGGMGAVYQARQPALDRLVALKILPATQSHGVNFAERFNREARALARLSHPNIVTVHEFGQTAGLHFFIMEFVDGANLRQLEQNGRLSPREALQIIPQICDALQYAHDQGVVHRDIKPENVLLDRKGRVKIADFGLAKILGVDSETLRLTAEGQVMGTPHYMAPEQVERPLAVDHRADIYSLGVVFYEMLTGDLPLGKFSPPSRKVAVDVRLDEVVLRALENDPARRYQQASDVKSRVETIAGTPAPGPGAGAKAEQAEVSYLRWAGFPLYIQRPEGPKADWKRMLLAFLVIFGVTTLLFGAVSVPSGRPLFGWLGVVGWPSVAVRIILAAAVVGLGARLARLPQLVSPEPPQRPQTPQGTDILTPTRFSRRALIGLCWMPFFFVALLLWITPVSIVQGPQHDVPPDTMQWWQVLLSLTLLPLGLLAPFGTTALGWFAVGSIRRERGRIRGLPLAVFDGLFFPLLGLDAFLVWLWRSGLLWFKTQTALDFFLSGPPTFFVVAGAFALCAIVDLLIVCWVWRAVRLDRPASSPRGNWWWSTTRGAVTIGVLCALMIALTALRHRQPGRFKDPPQQVARLDAKTGSLIAQLPNGGVMELLAIGAAGAARDKYWTPQGRAHAATTFEFETAGSLTVPNTVPKDLIFRFSKLPDNAPFPLFDSNPGSGHSTGDTVRRNGLLVEDTWPVRMAWPTQVNRVTLRLGVSLVPWRTVGSWDPAAHSSTITRQPGDPNQQVNFHQVGERNGHALLTLVRALDDEKWETRVVAVDAKDQTHEPFNGTGTPTDQNETWTYTFLLSLAAVKEFRVQIRPLHWVEFRKVALRSPDIPESMVVAAPGSEPVHVQEAETDLKSGALIARLPKGGKVELLAVSESGAAPNEWWLPDGTAIPDSLYEVLQIGVCSSSGWTNKDLVVRLRDLPDGADGPSLKFLPNGGSSAGGELMRNGKVLQGGWPVRAAFQPTAIKTTMRLGFGLDPWQTISIHDRSGNNHTDHGLPGVPDLHARVHQVGESAGHAQVTMLLGKENEAWKVRVVGVDTNGVEHTPNRGAGTPADVTTVWTYDFYDLAFAATQEFLVQVRPVHWVEFMDIALVPRDRSRLGKSTRVFKPTAFGEIQEAHITDLFDFDRGLPGVFPTAKDGTKFYDGIERNESWSLNHGYDVEARTNQLGLLQLFVADVTRDEWENLRATEIAERLNRGLYHPRHLPAVADARLPTSHAFRTRDNAMGLLQILSFDSGRLGATVRYKLVQPAHLE